MAIIIIKLWDSMQLLKYMQHTLDIKDTLGPQLCGGGGVCACV